MRKLLLGLMSLGLIGLAGCSSDRQEAATAPSDERAIVEQPAMTEDSEVTAPEAGERQPASTLTREMCTELEEDGLTDAEKEIHEQCREEGLL